MLQCDALEKAVMVGSLISHRGYNEDPRGELQVLQERTCWVANHAAVAISLPCASSLACSMAAVLCTGMTMREEVTRYFFHSHSLPSVPYCVTSAQ